MKNIILDRLFPGICILMLISPSCDRSNSDGSYLASIQNHDQFVNTSQIITIHDKSGKNKLTLRILCKNSELLTEFTSSHWQLITMINQDIGIEPIPTDDDYSTTKTIRAIGRMQIEIVKMELQPDVVGYYIEKKFNPEKLNQQYKNKQIETEFISAYESFGGYIQIATAVNNNNNPVRYIAETLDDPMVEPKVGIIASHGEHRYLSIGFSDVNGLDHSWRVIVSHNLSTFPIVYWIKVEKQVNQYP